MSEIKRKMLEIGIVTMILIAGFVIFMSLLDDKKTGTNSKIHNDSSNITYQYDDRTHICFAHGPWAYNMMVVECTKDVIEQAIKDHSH